MSRRTGGIYVANASLRETNTRTRGESEWNGQNEMSVEKGEIE